MHHFSVLRGIDAHTVWLADPSLGNRTYSKAQFLEMWKTRADADNAGLAGKFLAVLPAKETDKEADKEADKEVDMAGDFFTKAPRRQSASAIARLAFRPAY